MKTILVTGANKGIGLAVVEAVLAEQPEFNVLLGSRDSDRGEHARDALLEAHPGCSDRLAVLELDVSSAESVVCAAAVLASEDVSLFGLVNNAGIASGSLEEILNVNVYGIQRVCDAFAHSMPAGGRIVNVTSASGPNYVAECSEQQQSFFRSQEVDWEQLHTFMMACVNLDTQELEAQGLPGDASYGLSKACANVLTVALSQRFPQLQINACTPGFIETDLTKPMLGDRTPEDAGMKQPADGARVVMKLLFDDVEGTGHYYGSDGLRSPLDRYRAPGSPAYAGD